MIAIIYASLGFSFKIVAKNLESNAVLPISVAMTDIILTE